MEWKSLETGDVTDLSIPEKSGEIYAICPSCSGGRKKSKVKCLALNPLKGVGHCQHCADSFVRDNFNKEVSMEKEHYSVPEYTNTTGLSDNVLKWFKDRCISQRTLNDLKVTEGKHNIRQKDSGEYLLTNCINFNYFRDNSIVMAKYRDGKKNFGIPKGSELILYNLDSLKDSDYAVITEGEIDALSFHEAGITSVVSVPNGAAVSAKEKEYYKETGNFIDENVLSLKFLDNSYESYRHIKTWYIATDSDVAGMKLKQELVRRFGAINCKLVSFGNYKDANELLKEDGVLALNKSFDNAVDYPISGIIDLDSQWDYIMDVYENGYKKGLSTGINYVDQHYTFRLGELDTISGFANRGKTTFMVWLMCVSSVRYGWKWAIFSPENYPAGEIYITLMEMYEGLTMDRDKDTRMSKSQLYTAKSFVKEHFFAVDSDNATDLDSILEKFELLIKKKGVNGVLIDPWNDLTHSYTDGVARYLEKELTKVRYFKRKHNIKFVINAHSNADAARRIDQKTGRPQTPTFYDIDGGAMWANKSDNMHVIDRDIDGTAFDLTEWHVRKIKIQKLVGLTTKADSPILLRFVPHLCRLVGMDGTDPLSKTKEKHLHGIDDMQTVIGGSQKPEDIWHSLDDN